MTKTKPKTKNLDQPKTTKNNIYFIILIIVNDMLLMVIGLKNS